MASMTAAHISSRSVSLAATPSVDRAADDGRHHGLRAHPDDAEEHPDEQGAPLALRHPPAGTAPATGGRRSRGGRGGVGALPPRYGASCRGRTVFGWSGGSVGGPGQAQEDLGEHALDEGGRVERAGAELLVAEAVQVERDGGLGERGQRDDGHPAEAAMTSPIRSSISRWNIRWCSTNTCRASSLRRASRVNSLWMMNQVRPRGSRLSRIRPRESVENSSRGIESTVSRTIPSIVRDCSSNRVKKTSSILEKFE